LFFHYNAPYVIVRLVETAPPFKVAVIEAIVSSVTEVVVTVNVTLELPDVIVTVAGTEACTSSDDRVITVPPVGAGPTIVTAQVVGDPPETVVAVNDNPDKLSGLIQYRSSVEVSN